MQSEEFRQVSASTCRIQMSVGDDSCSSGSSHSTQYYDNKLKFLTAVESEKIRRVFELIESNETSQIESESELSHIIK